MRRVRGMPDHHIPQHEENNLGCPLILRKNLGCPLILRATTIDGDGGIEVFLS
jgi:hypothetical protein